MPQKTQKVLAGGGLECNMRWELSVFEHFEWLVLRRAHSIFFKTGAVWTLEMQSMRVALIFKKYAEMIFFRNDRWFLAAQQAETLCRLLNIHTNLKSVNLRFSEH